MSSIASIHIASAGATNAFALRASRSSSAAPTGEELFASVDSDGDGQLSQQEFDAALQGAQPQSFDLSALSTQGFAGLCAAGQRPPPPPGDGADPIAALDSDGSGTVSAAEFGLEGSSSAMQAMFAAIDGDGDGELSTRETEAFRSAMQQAMGAAERPQGPPPGPPPAAAGDTAGSRAGASDDSSTREELLDFLQKLSEMFAGQYADVADGKALGTASTLSVTA